MSRGICSPDDRASCPLGRCAGSDLHHLEFPSNNYTSKVEKVHRDQPFNKVQLPRCVHRAIHASGYVPQKPEHSVMVDEIWDKGSERAELERERQIAIGKAVIEEGRYPNGRAEA